MTQITVQDGKIVLRDGKVGTGEGCCCGEGENFGYCGEWYVEVVGWPDDNCECPELAGGGIIGTPPFCDDGPGTCGPEYYGPFGPCIADAPTYSGPGISAVIFPAGPQELLTEENNFCFPACVDQECSNCFNEFP